MSRIGLMPVEVKDDKVKIIIENNFITVEGSKGKLKRSFAPEIEMKYDKSSIVVSRKNNSKRARSLHGLYRNLVNNMVKGVSEGFTKVLQIIGVGFKAEVKGKNLVLNLGFAHPVEYQLPDGVSCNVEANTKIIVSSVDNEKLGQACAEIRAFKPPEPYKGKGIRYENEFVRRKVGKTGIK